MQRYTFYDSFNLFMHTKLHYSLLIPCYVDHNLIIATRCVLIPEQLDFDAHQLNQQQTSPR